MVACRPPSGPRRQDGFTYVGLIVLVAIVGLVGAATLKADALLRRAAAEQELLEIGAAFSAALTSYAEATPRGQPTQPPSLEELLKDPRFPGTRRHLRKIFVDPLTGKAEWGIVWLNKGSGADGGSGVVAVYSLSQARPLKQANFDARFQNLEGSRHIADWKFAAGGQGVVQGRPGQPGEPPTGSPSLFPGSGNPGTSAPPPAEPPQPALEPGQLPPGTSAPPPPEPEAEPPPPSEASGSGDDEKDEKDEKEEKAKQERDARDSKRR